MDLAADCRFARILCSGDDTKKQSKSKAPGRKISKCFPNQYDEQAAQANTLPPRALCTLGSMGASSASISVGTTFLALAACRRAWTRPRRASYQAIHGAAPFMSRSHLRFVLLVRSGGGRRRRGGGARCRGERARAVAAVRAGCVRRFVRRREKWPLNTIAPEVPRPPRRGGVSTNRWWWERSQEGRVKGEASMCAPPLPPGCHGAGATPVDASATRALTGTAAAWSRRPRASRRIARGSRGRRRSPHPGQAAGRRRSGSRMNVSECARRWCPRGGGAAPSCTDDGAGGGKRGSMAGVNGGKRRCCGWACGAACACRERLLDVGVRPEQLGADGVGACASRRGSSTEGTASAEDAAALRCTDTVHEGQRISKKHKEGMG